MKNELRGTYMALKLMYITNKPEVAKIAELNGINIIFVDLEWIGKEERQHNVNSVKSNHTLEDVSIIRKTISKAELLVRVNPLNPESKNEIDEVIKRGADIIMLPMFRTKKEVETFIKLVNGRCKVMLLAETIDAMSNLKEIVKVRGIDYVHIGLNDLHLELHKKFMFELLIDGTVEKMSEILKNANIQFGFGGIARLDEGMLPARHILGEHYRLKSSMAILSRSFYDSWLDNDIAEINRVFKYGIIEIREYEQRLSKENMIFFVNNHKLIENEIEHILSVKK